MIGTGYDGSRMKRITALFRALIILLQIHSATLEIIVHPRDTEAVVGHMTYLNCSTSEPSTRVRWYYYAVGVTDQTYIYFMGEFLAEYKDRCRLEEHEESGTFNLVIETVQARDAGRYFCKEDGGEQLHSSAELIVLENVPVCKSNMEEEAIIGPNNCGFKIEQQVLLCNATYKGNIPPKMEWRKDGEIFGDQQKNYSGYVTSEVSIPGDLSTNAESFPCSTTRSVEQQYGCSLSSTQIRILYAVDNYAIEQKKEGEKATCAANSSQPCNYKWIWFYGTEENVASNNKSFSLPTPGVYRCEAVCILKDKHCRVLAGQVVVSTTSNKVSNCDSYMISIICLAIFLPLSNIVVVFATLHCTRKQRNRQEAGTQEEQNQLGEMLKKPGKNKEVMTAYNGTKFVTLKQEKHASFPEDFMSQMNPWFGFAT